MLPVLSPLLAVFFCVGFILRQDRALPVVYVPTVESTRNGRAVGRESLFNISGKVQGLVLIGPVRSCVPLWACTGHWWAKLWSLAHAKLGKYVRLLKLKQRVWEVEFPKAIKGTVIRRKRNWCWAVTMINVHSTCSRRSKRAVIPSVRGYAEKPEFSGNNGWNESGQNLPGRQSNEMHQKLKKLRYSNQSLPLWGMYPKLITRSIIEIFKYKIYSLQLSLYFCKMESTLNIQ